MLSRRPPTLPSQQSHLKHVGEMPAKLRGSTVERLEALKELLKLSNTDGDEVALVEEYSLMQPICDIILDSSPNPEHQVYALKFIANVAVAHPNKVPLLEKYNVVSPLLHAMRTSSDEEVTKFACWAMVNLSDINDNHVPLVDRGVVKPLLHVLKTTSNDGGKTQACKVIANVAITRANHQAIIREQVVPAMVDILRSAPRDCSLWDNNGLYSWASSGIGRLSDDDDPLLREDIKNAGAVDVLEPFANSHSYQGLKAVMTLAFLVGRDEESASNVARLNPQHTERLLDLLTNTLNKTGEEGSYKYGVFPLESVVRTLRAFTSSDTNTSLLASSRRGGRLLWRVVHEYLSNSAPIEPAEVAVQCLASMSLFLSSQNPSEPSFAASKLREWWEICRDGAPKPCTIQTLHDALLKVRSAPNKTMELDTIGHVDTLLHDLGLTDKQQRKTPLFSFRKTKVEVAVSTNPVDPTSKHVMFSYAWQSQKEVVVEVCRLLKQQYSIDVWREDEGSKVCHDPKLDMYDAMATAVELAECMVVFVSMAYTESANCRRELLLAAERGVPMVFVRLDEHYRPSGTLGNMAVGKPTVMGCFKGRQASQVASELAVVVRSLCGTRASSVSTTPSSPSSPSHSAAKNATVPLSSLTVDEVATLMDSLKLQHFTHSVREKTVSGPMLSNVRTVEDVKEINSQASGLACRAVVRHVDNLRENGVPTELIRQTTQRDA